MDTFFGAANLQEISKDYFNKLNEFEQFKLFKSFREFKNRAKDDAIINILCQYSSLGSMSIEDFYWITRLMPLVEEGHVWLSMLSVDNYAFKDKKLKKNIDNITSSHNNITVNTDDSVKSDGIFDFEGELLFRRLKFSDEDEDLETLALKDFYGTIEFGYQPLCKTVMSIMLSHAQGNSVLMRVPYKSPNLPPVIAFLYCSKEITT